MLTLWATLMTVLAVLSGIAGRWDDFWETLFTAIGSWIAVALAADNKMPEDAFGAG